MTLSFAVLIQFDLTEFLSVCFSFSLLATEGRSQETDPTVQVDRYGPGQDAELRVVWQPGVLESRLHPGHLRLCQ